MELPPGDHSLNSACVMDDLSPRKTGVAAAVGRGILRWQVPLLAVVFFSVYAVIFIRSPQRGDWMTCYLPAAQRLQAGELLQRDELSAYMYPPAMAMIAVPLSNVSPRVSAAGWYVVNVLAMYVLFVSAWRLAGGPALIGLDRRWRIVFWLTLALAGRWLISPLENKQFDLLIASLATVGALYLARGSDWKGGIAIGLAASMKCTPLLFLPYLCWRGKWSAAVMLIAAAIMFNLAPDWIWPRTTGQSYLIEWCQFTAHTLGQQMPGGWWSDPQLNQSLAGMFRRVLGWTLDQGEVLDPEVAQQVRWAINGSAVMLLGITAWRFGRPFRAADAVSHRTSVPSGQEQQRTAQEAAAVMCLMLLLSPMSGKAHFVILLLPLLLLASAAVARRGLWIVLAVVLLMTGPLVAKGIVGKQGGDLLMMWGVPTWHVLITLAGIWALLGRGSPTRESNELHGQSAAAQSPVPKWHRRALERSRV